MKSVLLSLFLLTGLLSFSQKYGTILVSDYDDQTLSVEGVSVYFGNELLGMTNHVGSFHFPRKIKGIITLSRADYVARELPVKSRENGITDTYLIADQPTYDSRKAALMPVIYGKCLGKDVQPVRLSGNTSALSLQTFDEYVASVMQYPNRARDAGASGTVELQFRIDPDGFVNCVEIVKGVSFDLDKEAFRILSTTPKWIPAKRNGIPVETVYSIEIPFVLNP